MKRVITGFVCPLFLGLAAFCFSASAFAVDAQISSFIDNPDPAVRGGNISYTITVQNSDADTAHNVVVTYPLPASSQFVSANDPAQPGACTFDGLSPGTVTCTYASLLGTLAAPTPGPIETITVIVKTTGTSVTTLTSTVTVTTTDVDTNPSNNSLSQNTTINNGADLSAATSGTPNPAAGAGNVTWTISGSNLGPNSSGAVTYTSTLPGVLTYVAAGSGGGGWTCSAAGQVVTCTLAAQAVGSYPNLPIVTKVTGVGGGTITLSGSITSTVGDPDLSNNSPVASVTVNPGTDLAVTQSAPTPSPAISGGTVTFALQPSNGGPYPASAGANVTFPLPAGFTVTSATGSTGWVCAFAGSPTTVTCTFAGSIASGASGTLTIAATAPTVATPTAYNNITATIAPNSGGPTDPNAANNTASRNVTVSPDGLDLSVSKSKSPAVVAVGAHMTSTIVVANSGPRTAATGTITVVDALDPTKEQYVSFSGTNWTCVSATPNVNCTYNAALAIANASTLTITTQALISGTITNNATSSYSGSPGDFNSANNTIGASVTATDVNNSPDLQVGLIATTAGGVQTTVEANETQITYTLALTNKVIATPVNAQNVVVTLSVPGRLTTTNVTVSQLLTNTSGTSTATFTCTGTGTGSTGNVVCTQTGSTLLSPGDVMTFTAVANRPMLDVTSVNATASAVSTSQGDPLPSDNTATVPITIIPIADVELVSKLLAANPVLAGTNATYTITLKNDGPSSAAGVSMADVFTIPGGDTGFTFVSVVASNSGVCSGLTAGTSYASGTPTETCTWAAVVANASTRTVTIVVRPNWQAGAGARTLANTATVSTTTAEDSVGGQGTFVDSKSLTLNINAAQVDMLINDSDLVDPIGYDPSVASNNDITYAVVETNNGPSLASGTGFSFTMTPPSGKTITFRGDGASSGVAAANPSGTIAGSLCGSVGTSITGPSTMTVTCLYAAPGQLANAASQTRYLVFRVGTAPNVGGDTYTTLATVIVNETDTNLSNNTEGETTTVRVRADLSVVKTASVNPAQLRQPLHWSIVVANAGPGDSQTTGLTDTLPAGMAFSGATPSWTSTSGGSGTCVVAGLSLTCTFGILPASQSATVIVPVKVTTYPSGGTTQNCATATTSEVDPNSANNLSICGTVTVQFSSLAGTVFQDRDRVGANAGTPQSAATEPRISGVTIKLAGNDAYGNAVSLTTTSDVNGAYSFTNLSPADSSGYTITETQPAGFVNGPANPPAPAAGGTYSAGGSAGNSSYAAILLAGNTVGVSYDFPEVRQPSLSGFVYLDSNANGTRDAGTDGVISGATVRLLNAGTLAVIATTTTDGTGAYSFTGLDPLTVYTLEEPLPSTPTGLGDGAVNPGLINGAACVSGCTAQANTPVANTDRIASIDLGAGTDGTVFNFGELQQTSLSGLVFVDANRNNLLDGSDTGRISGVTLRLVQGADCSSGTTRQTTTTAGDGTYSFANVLAFQNYLICETQPAGYGNGIELPGTNGTTPGANVIAFNNLAAAGSSGNNFGERVAAVSGSVYQDSGAGTPANFNNGVRDSGESGIVNVPVTLSGNDQFGTPVSLTVNTDASGNFSFDGLFPPNGGGYTLTEGVIPAASGSFLQGKDAAGTAGGSIAVQDVTSAIAVTAGQQATGYLFGELPQTAVSGTIYVDRNRNNAIDATPTDGRIAGVTLRLVTGSNCTGGTTLQTVSSANDGTYSFGNVAGGGSYLVCETQPSGYANGIENPGTSATTPGANVIAITNLPSGGSSGNNFGERIGSLAGSVYQDTGAGTPANFNNGARDSGESGIVNVPVTVTGHDITGATVNVATTTDAGGNYAFTDLLQSDASGYTVSEGVIPSASGSFLQGKDAAGIAGGNIAVQDVISGVVLGAGVQTTGYLFGELPQTAVSGTVYIDRNRNNTIDATPTDGRIAGVTLRLVTGADCSSGTTLQTATSANDGTYSFTSVAGGGNYLVCETQPSGYANGIENPGTSATTPGANVIAITNLPSGGSSANNFGERVASIAGSVYQDYSAATPANTNNGLRDSGEVGIVNVPVTLTGHDINGAGVNATLSTDASGNYVFADLLQSDASGYVVSEGAIAAASGTFLQGKDAAGTAGGSVAVQDVTTGIVLAAGNAATGYLFGELPIAPISGTVYVDRNRNGTMDATPTDGRIAGATLNLHSGSTCAGTVLATTSSDASGSYSFSGIAAGSTVTICETQPTGYADGSVTPGTSAASGAANAITVTNLPSGGSPGNLFGEQVGSLAGSVYLDYTAGTPANNNNGARDAGEPGIANVPVMLTGHDASGTGVNLSTTTDASGNYSFSDLLQSDASGYIVSEGAIPTASGSFLQGKDAAGTAGGSIAVQDVTSGIALTAGQQATGYLFGELPNTSLSGTVYIDLNRNGSMDATPTDGRIANVTVRLLQGASCASGTLLQTTTSAADGSYTFSGVAGGQNYLVCETQPTGYGQGSVNPGTSGTTPATDTILVTNLPSTGSTGNLFGEQVGSLAGSVYLDYSAAAPANNNNGARDAGEPGIANVPITLTGHDAAGASVALSTTTDASGNYLFASLLQSDASGYTVTEGAIPAASGSFLQGKDAAGTAGGSIAVQDVTRGIALAAGNNATGYLFGELPNASITGSVYLDLNRNGTMDPSPTDGRIANVTVRLLQGASCASGTLLQTTASAADGSYAFSGVAGGQNYLICETQPIGYGQGSVNPGTSGSTPAAATILITNLPSTGSAGNLFGEQVGSLTGSVYLDYSAATPANNNNGARDGGEPGIASVPMTLTGHDAAGGVVNLSTTTDASGNYLFASLLQSDASGYTVTEGAIPAASGSFLQGKDAAGTAGGSIAVQDVTSGIVLAAGNVATGYLFGELPNASIAGSVYLDLNRNGTMDATPTDGRIANVTVRLLQGASCASGTLLQTTTSGADGSYTFSGVAGGQNYLVCETQPTGYAQGTVNPGTNGTTPATDTILVTNLPPTGSTGNLFGERAGSISGNVFLDANDDGLRTGDVGIASVTVTLTGSDAGGAAVLRTTTTDATGAYRFDAVLGAGAGGYALTEQSAQPVVGGKTTLNGKTTAGSSGGTATAVATTPSAVASIALATGADSSENNFAEILPISLAGVVFVDLNNNGVQNLPGDSGIAAVAIVVTGTDDNGAAVTRNVTTGVDGSYSLPDLRPGTYTLTEPAQPIGTTNGQTIAGSAGGIATGPTVTPSAISGVVLTPGSSATAYNFAELNNTSVISGRVWLDSDNNGAINGTEAGIAGVTINFTGTDLGGAAVSRTTTTDASGNFSFASLAPGTYTLGEPTQPTGTLNGKTVAGSAGGTPTPVATTPSAIAGIVIGAGQSSIANNFGELPGGSIAGHVISDSNNNGKLDAGESGIANVSLVLTGTDDQGAAVNASTTSDANGAYNFGNLRPGSYTLTEPTQPPGTDNGITTAGMVNGTTTGTATSPATTPSAISGIVLPAGGASTGNDFAEIGSSPDVLVSKASVEARFTVNNVGTYTISVRNGGEIVTAAAYRVSDRLPLGLTLNAVPTGTGWTCAGAIGASSFTCSSSDVMAAGASNANSITVKVLVAASAAQSSPAINAVMVDGGGELPARAPSPADLDGFNNTPASLPPCVAGITQNACRAATIVQASASLSGTAWYDIGNAHNVLDGGDQRLAGWQVEVLDASGNIVARATTAADGTYKINDLLPGVALHVRFRDPASNVVWGYPVNGEAAAGSSGASCNTQQAIANGTASSCAGSGNDPTLTIVLAAGANLAQQSLPVDPSGVIYDSGTRQPVPGAVVTLAPSGSCAGWDPSTGLVGSPLGGYTVNGSAVSMTVGANGFYQFLLGPAAPASCTFSLTVAPPAGYTFTSVLIPPTAGPYVPAGAPGSSSAVQPQAGAPTGAVGPATTYYLTVAAGSGTANVVNNHIPLDPAAAAGLSLSKTGDKAVAEIGDSVRYTLTVLRSSGAVPREVTIVDRLPAGFTFIPGTALLNGVTVSDPAGKPGPALTFDLGTMPSTGQLVLQYRVRVGVGAQQGDGTNRAIGYGCGVPAGCTASNGTSPLPGSTSTNEARFKVTVGGGVFTTDACFAGKIFVDCNGNHIQDPEEIGIPGVRLLLSDGTTLISDSEGKFSYCGLSPRSAVIRVDETTLPRGSRLTTSSNRNLGDAGSLWLDLKNGELDRADFIEGSCSANVLDQVKARRAQGEVRSVETEKKSLPALKFDSRDKGPRPRTDASPSGSTAGGAP